MGDTRIRDFYESAEEFNEILEAAEENATNDSEMDFVDRLSHKVKSFGMQTYITERQNDWLRRIANAN